MHCASVFPLHGPLRSRAAPARRARLRLRPERATRAFPRLFVLCALCVCGCAGSAASDRRSQLRDASARGGFAASGDHTLAASAARSEPRDGGASAPDAGRSPGSDASSLAPDASAPSVSCPAQMLCVDQYPARIDGDFGVDSQALWEHYSCQGDGGDDRSHAGPERVFRVLSPAAGFLSAALRVAPGVVASVQILSALDPRSCLSTGESVARADVAAGPSYVVVDSAAGSGVARPGGFSLDIGLLQPSRGPCNLLQGTMERVGDQGQHLPMPALGPVVREAHLVTQAEPPPYPSTAIDELEAHYALSQAATGLVMQRREAWAPLEGGEFFGAGIASPSLLPVIDEGWYVNMYWTREARPARGTRMLVQLPSDSARAVVVAAGHETGPGDLHHVAGASEETHFYLGTRHLDTLRVGITADPALPLGPRRCE